MCSIPACPTECEGNCEAVRLLSPRRPASRQPTPARPPHLHRPPQEDDGSLRCASKKSDTTLTLGLAIAGASLGVGVCLLVVAWMARSGSDMTQGGGVGELWLRRRWRGAHTSSRVHSLPVHVPARKGPPDAPKLTSSTGIAQWA